MSVAQEAAEDDLYGIMRDQRKEIERLRNVIIELRRDNIVLRSLLVGIRDGIKYDANSDSGVVRRIDDALAREVVR